MTKTRQELIELFEKLKEAHIEMFDSVINKIRSRISAKELMETLSNNATSPKMETFENELKILFSHLVIEELMENFENETTNNGGNA